MASLAVRNGPSLLLEKRQAHAHVPNGKEDSDCSMDDKGHEECLWAKRHFKAAAHSPLKSPPRGKQNEAEKYVIPTRQSCPYGNSGRCAKDTKEGQRTQDEADRADGGKGVEFFWSRWPEREDLRRHAVCP